MPELVFKFSRSSGAGGQNVNKVSTKAELSFDIDSSMLLSEQEKARIKEKLANFINLEGLFKLSSQEKRTQQQNKDEAVSKFYRLLEKALHVQKKRVPTKPSAASRAKRLLGKKVQSLKKEQRRKDF